MDNAEYHARPEIGSSFIKLMAEKTPLHAWARYLDPAREVKEPTPAMMLGTLVHSAVLEPELFDDYYTVLPEGLNGNTKAGKEFIKEVEQAGKTPVKNDTWLLAKQVSEAANKHPFMVEQRKNGAVFEQSFFCELHGVKVKCRPDILVPPTRVITDLKTTVNASPEGFPREIWNLQMHVAAALYTSIVQIATNSKERPEFYWLAQEKDGKPFANAVYKCTEEMFYEGDVVVRRQLAIIKECQRAGVWPGYDNHVMDAEFPVWAYNKLENDLDITMG